MPTVVNLHRLPTVPPSWPVSEDTTDTRPLFGIYSEAISLLERFHADFQEIDAPGGDAFRKLTPAGRTDAKRELAERALAAMRALRARPAFAKAGDGIRAEYHTVRASAPVGVPADAVAALQAREIRDWYRSLDAHEALRVRRHALAVGDAALIAALLGVPSPAMALIPEGEAKSMEQTVIQRSSPERFEYLRAWELAYRAVEETLDRFERYIAGAGSVELPYPPAAYVPILSGLPPAA